MGHRTGGRPQAGPARFESISQGASVKQETLVPLVWRQELRRIDDQPWAISTQPHLRMARSRLPFTTTSHFVGPRPQLRAVAGDLVSRTCSGWRAFPLDRATHPTLRRDA